MKPRARRPFKVRARPLRARPNVDFDRVSTAIERIEGPHSQ